MPKEGVVYIAWGQKARDAAGRSIASLRAVADYPVMVVGDAEVANLDAIAQVKPVEIDPFQTKIFLAGRVKPILYSLVPREWERVLYVDADTTFRSSPALAFSLLERGWDFLAAETGNRSLADQICGANEADYTRKWFGVKDILYHNSGMLAWRQCPAVDRLFALWTSEWLRFGHWDEQVALLRAMARSEAMFLTLPTAWNTNFPSKAALISHQFGQRVAWKYGQKRHNLSAEELRKMAKEWREKGMHGRNRRVEAIDAKRPAAGPTPIDIRKMIVTRQVAKPRFDRAVKPPKENKEKSDG